MWSVRTLDRNISTQYYERHYVQPQLPMKEEHPNQFELLKSPIVAEILGFKQDYSYSEEELESAIIDHIQEFMMEMGRGFAFMGRQQLVRTDTQDYYIDLVFYNVVLKCYCLLDESDFIGSEGILAIELLVDNRYVLLPNCWRLLMKVLTLTAPSIGESSKTI